MEELDPQDARTEAISPAMFDDSVRIAQFVSDGHLHSDMVSSAIGLGYDALLFHGTGLGHLPISDPQDDSPENTKLRLLLEDYCQEGGVAVVVTQAVHGPVHLDVYSKGRVQQSIGMIGNGSLCPPGSALVKLHFLLSRDKSHDSVSEGWDMDLLGENPPSVRN
tara:strand:- start:931 stop:1422 length:492 start_codon:yes stop_codon:yes gene_type:complete